MAETLDILHERIDDIPLIIGVANRLNLPEILNQHLNTHGLQQGLHNGLLAVGWIAYILSEGDHRKSAVEGWAKDVAYTLEQMLGQPIREIEFSDDRLGNLLRRFSDDEAWRAIEQTLWQETMVVYDLPLDGVRLDATTSYGHHQPQEGGVMQHGHSKDHRPDLPQLKLMAAAGEPTGHLIASDVVSGEQADDPLYAPIYRRVRTILGRDGLLYAGDSKMAALDTRAEMVNNGDYYLVPLPLTGETGQQFDAWVDRIVDGEVEATLVWDGKGLRGGGYEFERQQEATVDGQPVSWTERVQLFRSRAQVRRQSAGLEKRLRQAERRLRALTPEPGPGRQQIRDEDELREAIRQVLAQQEVDGLLQVTWQREETKTVRYKGRGRPGPNRPRYIETTVRYVITDVQRDEAAIAVHKRRFGWRVQATNAPAERLSFAESILHYRQGWCVERDFHLMKERPLGLSPLFVWKDEQIKGLTRLLTLALRILMLIEIQVRQGLAADEKEMVGLYEGNPNRRTDRPTGRRLLRAFSRAKIDLTRIRLNGETYWHVTPLQTVHKQILSYLLLPVSLYAQLAPP
jgi:transposase